MTPRQAYAQWKQYAGDPADSEAQSIQKFSQQFGVSSEDENDLIEAYPDQPRYTAPKKSGFLSQTWGAGTDQMQKGFGESLAGPGAKIIKDMGWEGGGEFLEDLGSGISQQQDIDLQEYESPQTRDELIAEGGLLGSFYENILPEETNTPEQLGRSVMSSMLPAAAALTAAGIASLIAPAVVPIALGWTGKAVFTGATAAVVGNITGSFQVGGEEFENAKKDPFIRQQLGINPDDEFANLEPAQQKSLTDSAQRVAKDTMVERLYTSGALESLAFIPYGAPLLRYVADIALGSTSEELDKRLGMENTIEELQRLGIRKEEVPELREKIKALRPGTFETVWNAAIMEALIGGPVNIIETVSAKDDRISEYASEDSKKNKLLAAQIEENLSNPEKAVKLRQDDINYKQNLKDRAEQRAKKRKIEQHKLNTSPESGLQGDALEKITVNLERADGEIDELGISSSQAATDAEVININTESISSATFEDTQDLQAELFGEDTSPDYIAFDLKDKNDISLGGIEHQGVIDTINGAVESVDYIPSTFNIDTGSYQFIDASGNLVDLPAGEVGVLEGFTYDLDPINPETGNPRVYITQHMADPKTGMPIRSLKGAIKRAVQVAFHEGITHTSLRQILNAGEPKTITQTTKDDNGVETTSTVNDPSNEWTGDEYNNFIYGVRKRELKKINRWLDSNSGQGYRGDSPFRQTEEWIARNFGESGGGRELGYFDNIAIALRESAPWLNNSFNQYQVAKMVQSAVKQRVKVDGDVDTVESNILTGVELVAAIVRGAAGANLEADVIGEEQVRMRDPFLRIPQDAGVRIEENTERIKNEDLAKTEIAEKEKRHYGKIYYKAARKKLKEETKATEKTNKKIGTATEKINANLDNYEFYSINKNLATSKEGTPVSKIEQRGRTLGQSIIETKLYNESADIINQVLGNTKGLTKAHKKAALAQIGSKNPELLTYEIADILDPGSIPAAIEARTKNGVKSANEVIGYLSGKKKKLKKLNKLLPNTEQKQLNLAKLFVDREKKGGEMITPPKLTEAQRKLIKKAGSSISASAISASAIYKWAPTMPASFGTTKADQTRWNALKPDSEQTEGVGVAKQNKEGKITFKKYQNASALGKTKMWKRLLDERAKRVLGPIKDKEGNPIKMGPYERLFGLYVNGSLFGKSVFEPALELQPDRRTEAMFYEKGKDSQRKTPEEAMESRLSEENIERLEKQIADAKDLPPGAPTGPNSPQARAIKRAQEAIAVEKRNLPESTTPESKYKTMKEAVETLTENEQNILKSVYGIHEDHSLAGQVNTAELYGISQPRVNKIKSEAIKKLGLGEGVQVRAGKEGFDTRNKTTEKVQRKSLSEWRAKGHLDKFLPAGELAYKKTIKKTKEANEIRAKRFELGRMLYEKHGIVAKPYRDFEIKKWASRIPGAWETDYKWAKENKFPPRPAPSTIKEGLVARKQEADVSTKTLKLNTETLQALEKRVNAQLQAESAPKSDFLNEATAEELIAAHESISASKGFQISNEAKQKAYDINRRLVAGEITKEEQTKKINKLMGSPRPWAALPKIPSLDKIKEAIGKKWNKDGKFITGFGETLPAQTVQTRLDINAYRNNDTWVPTMHDTNGKVLAYGPTSHLTGVNFHKENLDSYVKDALTIATGQTQKHPFAMYQGTWNDHDPKTLYKNAKDVLDSNKWTQVGMNPLRHSFFYDRSTGGNNGRPVISADEVIQIGGVLLAKGVKYGNINDFQTASFKGKEARPGKEAIRGSEGLPVTFSKAVDPVTWDGDAVQPGEINGTGTFNKSIVDAITKSGAADRALINSLIGEQFTRIPTDRFRTGTYKPLSNDPNHPFNKNPYFMKGGVGYTLTAENIAANAVWASDAVQINGGLVDQVKRGIRHGLIYFMKPDSHFSNKAVWKIYETETDWMLSQGGIDRDRLNGRVEEIIVSETKNWEGLRNALKKAKGEDNWAKLKSVIPGSTFEQRKPLLTWFGGNVIASGTDRNAAEKKAGIKTGFFSGAWDPKTLKITKMYKKINNVYGAPLSEIYPRITQSPNAANFSVIGITKFNDTFKNAKTGKTEAIRNNITAEEMGVPSHDAYGFIMPGEVVAYIGGVDAGTDFNDTFAEYLPIRQKNAKTALDKVVAELKFTDSMSEKLFSYIKRDGDFKPLARKSDGWKSMEEILQKKYKKQGVGSAEKRKTLVNEIVSHVNALRADKVMQVRKGFEMSSIPIPSVDPKILAQFTTAIGARKLYITPSRSAAENSRSRAATNATGAHGRWSNLVNKVVSAGRQAKTDGYTKTVNKNIRRIRPLSKIKGEKLYLNVRQLVQGQLGKWEVFGKSVHDALAKSKDPKAIYKYLTTPGASPSIIKNSRERVAAKKAKTAIEAIGTALVKRKLLKQSTIDEYKQKYGDYLPRVYLMHLLDDNTQTKIANGSLKPSDMQYLLKRKDIPKALRELVYGELADQPGAAAYLASRATMIPGKDIAIMDWMAKIKDLSLKNNLDWVLPKQFVTFNTMEELREIAQSYKNGDAIVAEFELEGDLTNMSSEITPMWMNTEGRRLQDMAGLFDGKANKDKRQIILELSNRMREKAKKSEPVLSTTDAKMYKQLPDSKRYGQLRGMYVQKQIAFDIMGGAKIATGDESNMERIFGDTGMMGRYNSYWKWAKVAANPPSWARNYMSNNILLSLAGIPLYSLPKLNLAAIKDFKNKGKYYQVALNQGVMSGNMSQAELGKLEGDFIDVQRKIQNTQSPLMYAGGMISKFMDKTSNIYGGLETISKIAAIKYGMEKKGMNESEAAAFANKWLFDYGLVTPSVKYASTAVVGAPFIRFQSHAIPLMLEVMLTKPWRLAPYYAIGYGMAELFKAKHDLDEDQYKAGKKALAEWLQEKAVNGILPPAIIPMPYLDNQGRMAIYDISWIAPWGMLGEMASEVQDGKFVDAAKTLGLMGGPLPDMLAALKTGIDPFTRRPITDELKSNTEQFVDYLFYITNLTTPSMMHTEYGALSRAYGLVTGKLDEKTGKPKYTGMQVALRFAGVNVYPTDLVEQRKKNVRRMDWEISTVKAQWKRRLKGLMKSKASREDIREAREEYREKSNTMTKERRDYAKNSRVPQSLKARNKNN